ncbi:MAG: hypothetical protein M1486_07380 [Gammaproteobacteria bacterium]|nr:hypothetical protein [Gammaproteobacteria bacterium]
MKRKNDSILRNPVCTKKGKTFNDFYQPNNNWLDFCGTDYTDVLKSIYPIYFQGDAPDYEKIKADILIPYTKKSNNKAHEVFKNLFKMPSVNTKTIVTDDLDHIESEFGDKIWAHGVEELKGGMYNLLLMCISNQVRVPSGNWGAFISGLPNISPVRHGPYYLIYSMPGINQSSVPQNNANLSDVARILVPFSENKDILKDKLEQMLQLNLIDCQAQNRFIDKLVTYQEFLGQLRSHVKKKGVLQESDNQLFFKSSPSIPPGPIDDNGLAEESHSALSEWDI